MRETLLHFVFVITAAHRNVTW